MATFILSEYLYTGVCFFVGSRVFVNNINGLRDKIFLLKHYKKHYNLSSKL